MLGDFLSRFRAKSTRSMYVSAWVKFLSLAYSARLKGASPSVLEPWVAKYVNDLRNNRRDLATDLRALGGACRSPRTTLGYQSAVRSLLAEAGIALPPGGAVRLSRARGQHGSPVIGEDLTPGKVLRVLEHLDTRGRAVLYILVSSGARLGEVLSLGLADLDLDSRPARFRVRDAEKRVSRVAFLSREAVGAIRVYLIVRDRFLASARSRGGTASGDLLFPIGPRAFEQVWNLALSKAGLGGANPLTGRRTLQLRSTRQFFAERMGTVLPPHVVRDLMGSTARTGGRGQRPPEEGLARFYLEGERAVTLHRSHRKETLARKVSELERIVAILREKEGEGNRSPSRLGQSVPGAEGNR
jgi:integrase